MAACGLKVIMPLGRGARDQLVLAVVEPESRIDVAALRLHRTIVRQEDALRTAFDDGRRDRRPGVIGEALSREQHGYILLAQHLQPFPDARGEERVVEEYPGLIEDEQRRPAVATDRKGKRLNYSH